MKIDEVAYEFKAANEFPALFSGYVAIGFAGGRWYAGADTNSPDDAAEKMIDAARLCMIPAAKVDRQFQPDFYPSTVKVFRVGEDV